MGMISRTGPIVIDVDAAGVAKYWPIPCPSNVHIKRVRVTSPSGGSGKVNFYSRKFIGNVNKIALAQRIMVGAVAKTQLKLHDRIDFVPGDPLKIALTTVPGYDNPASHLVLSVDDYNTCTLNTNFVYEVQKGTAQLIIPAADYPEWITLTEITVQSNVGEALFDQGFAYRSNDPQTNIGDARVIYIKFASAGIYQVGITAESLSY